MSAEPICEVCGARLPASAAGGPCPACLVRSAIGQPQPSFVGRGEAEPSPGGARRLGDYELLEEIARGGMGAVFRARQISLKRFVAVKVLLAAEFANETSRKRFRREAEAVASLNHQNIVSIYEVGEHERRLYFAMELIEGRNLAELTREKPVPARQAAQWLKTIAEAVHYAHQHGVLHRDLKPSNVLVDKADVPHVTDFGLAKLFEPGEELTLSGQVLGTPSYMPPEQADPKRGPTTDASDVYSLGAILYQLLTARPPFMAETLTQTLRLVAEGEAVSPRLLNPGVPRDLETICLKCLDKDPRRRYPRAQELADELGRFLKHEPIRARPLSPTAKLVRWCRRKPALAISIGAVATCLLALAIVFPVAFFRVNRARQLTEVAKRQTQQQLYVALLEQARATVRSREVGQRVRALEVVRQAAAITNSPELRREAFAALALPDLRLEREIATGSDITLAQLDPTFERIALCRGVGPVEIRATTDRRLLTALPSTSTNRSAFVGRWSSDGRFFALKRTQSADSIETDLEVWNVKYSRRVLLLHHVPYGPVSFHPTQPRVLTVSADHRIMIWHLEIATEIDHFDTNATPINLQFSPDGGQFAVLRRVGSDWELNVRDSSSGKVQSSARFEYQMQTLDWHPGNRWIALPDRLGDIHLMEVATGKTRVLGRHKSPAVNAVFSPDGNFLFSEGQESELICWDLRSMQRAFSASLQSSRLQFRADGQECAVPTESEVRWYAFERSTSCREFNAEVLTRLSHAIFSPDGRWLVATGIKQLALWNWLRDGAPEVITGPEDATPFFTADSSDLFAYWSNAIGRWHLSTSTNANLPVQLEPLPVNKSRPLYSALLCANDLVLIGDGGVEVVALTNAAKGNGRLTDGPAGCGCLSPDNRCLALRRTWEPWVWIDRMPMMTWLHLIATSTDVMNFAFAPRSDELAVATRAGVEFYDTTTWQRARLLPMPMDHNANLIFSPDGGTFWVTRDSLMAGLYDTRTLEVRLPLPAGTLPLAVSPDGRHLAVSVDARRLQVWDVVEVRRRFRELGIDWESD